MEHWKQLELHKSSSAFSLLRGTKAVGESECRDANFQLRVCVHALSKCVHYKKKERKKKRSELLGDAVILCQCLCQQACVCAVFLTLFVYMCSISRGADGNLH